MSHSKLINNPPPVAVLRSNDYCFLGILRSLASAGIRTIPIVFDYPGAKTWHSEKSKYFYNERTISNPFTHEKIALQELVSIGKSTLAKYKTKILLIPSSDTNLMFIQNNFDSLSPYFLQMGSVKTNKDILPLINKNSCGQILHDSKLPVPLTLKANEETDLKELSSKMSYPCIYKPAQKDYAQSFYSRHQQKKAIFVENRKELEQKLTEELVHGEEITVQEKIRFNGPQEEIPVYLYCDESGEIKLISSAIKRVIHPHPYGTAVELELIVDVEEDLKKISQSVCKSIKWHGFLMIEFIKDLKDGNWKIIELNFRPWLFIDFFRRCGLNYLKHYYDELYHIPFSQRVEQTPTNKSFYHISLSGALENYGLSGMKINLHFIKQWLEEANKNHVLSFTYFDPEDHEPFISELNEISSTYSLFKGDLFALTSKLNSN